MHRRRPKNWPISRESVQVNLRYSCAECRKPCFFRQFPPYRASSRINGANMATQMSKSQLIEKIATTTEVSKKEVKGVMEALVDVGPRELKKNGGFLVPGFAKFVVVKKPATKPPKGTNPLTAERMMFK